MRQTLPRLRPALTPLLHPQALSGSIGPATNWRVPFVVVAAPSLAVAVLMQLTTQEPPRGAFEEALRER
jgi:hypothetical protein